MEIHFFTLSKRINSTLRPSGVGASISFVYKDASDIHNPVIEISTFDPTWNYAKINDIYFYINSAQRISNTITLIKLQIDVLATYKDYITASSAFVKYGTNGVDETIPDGRYIKSVATDIYSKGISCPYFSSSPRLMLTVFGQGGLPNYYGSMTRTYSPTPVQAFMLANQVCAITDDIATELRKIFNNPYDSIISLRIIMANVGASYGENTDIILGNYNTGIQAYEVWQRVISGESTITIPWKFNDWRDASCTSLLLYVPGYGVITLNAADFYGQQAFKISYSLDAISGDIAWTISLNNGGIITTFEGCLGVEVPVGQTKTGLSGAISNIMGMAGNIANPAAFAQNGFGMEMSILTQTTTTKGQLGGVAPAGLFSDYVFTMLTNAPSEYDPGTVIGKPVGKIQRLSAGYVECQNASVSAPAYINELSQINSYLNGGVYIE